VLNALSQELHVSVCTGAHQEDWHFFDGVLAEHETTEAADMRSGTVLRFKPDSSLFNVIEVSDAAFTSYFRRLSYLHTGVRFSFEAGGNRSEYHAPHGITELFTAIAAPYQLMHEPIHITARDGDLTLELVMAYQSWSDNDLWCFINNGRAVEGGTHEQGLIQALKLLKKRLPLREGFRNGVVAIASIHYPGAFLEGCIKSRVGNPELKGMVARVVVNSVVEWLEARPSLLTQIRQLETFQIPEAWTLAMS
jgi:DNA gyrase subunit B